MPTSSVYVGIDVACAVRKRLPICVVSAGYPLMPLKIPKHLAALIPRGVGNKEIIVAVPFREATRGVVSAINRIEIEMGRNSDVSACAGFSDACIDKASCALVRPASEKRQGTKSREVGHQRCRELYGDLGTCKGIGIARRCDRTGWRGMPSEPIGADGWRERGVRCLIGPLPGLWKATIEREPPSRVGTSDRDGRNGRVSAGPTAS
jgi:hypothetical protein